MSKSPNSLATLIYERLAAGQVIKNPASKPLLATKLELPNAADYSNQLKLINDTAQLNATHYVAESMQQHKPWHQCVRFPHQYSEFVMITPPMAKVLMEYNIRDNRKQFQTDIAKYANDIKKDRWIPTAESVCINLMGKMYDGQHRCEAIIAAEKPAAVYMTWNVVLPAQTVTDSGRKRSLNDRMHMVLDVPIGNRGAALCRAMMRGSKASVNYSDQEIAEFAMKHEETIRWIFTNLPSRTGMRADLQAAAGKAFLWYGGELMSQFCARYRTVTFNGEFDPANVLYRFMSKARHVPGVTVYRKTVSAIDSFVNNRQIKALHEKDEDIFDWNGDWSVPNPTQKAG